MANALCFTPMNSFKSTTKPPGIATGCCLKSSQIHRVDVRMPKDVNFHMIVPKATGQGTKPNSIVCADCDGNGAVLCSQCKGTGVNSVDHFNGQFKAGGLCWLCRGKKDVLCGNCNGAGFLGGFMSTHDD